MVFSCEQGYINSYYVPLCQIFKQTQSLQVLNLGVYIRRLAWYTHIGLAPPRAGIENQYLMTAGGN